MGLSVPKTAGAQAMAAADCTKGGQAGARKHRKRIRCRCNARRSKKGSNAVNRGHCDPPRRGYCRCCSWRAAMLGACLWWQPAARTSWELLALLLARRHQLLLALRRARVDAVGGDAPAADARRRAHAQRAVWQQAVFFHQAACVWLCWCVQVCGVGDVCGGVWVCARACRCVGVGLCLCLCLCLRIPQRSQQRQGHAGPRRGTAAPGPTGAPGGSAKPTHPLAARPSSSPRARRRRRAWPPPPGAPAAGRGGTWWC